MDNTFANCSIGVDSLLAHELRISQFDAGFVVLVHQMADQQLGTLTDRLLVRWTAAGGKKQHD